MSGHTTKEESPINLLNSLLGAENETRTRDPNLGKVMLYQLSYFRNDKDVVLFEFGCKGIGFFEMCKDCHWLFYTNHGLLTFSCVLKEDRQRLVETPPVCESVILPTASVRLVRFVRSGIE